LVPSLGIEPSSHALQACAEITRLAHSVNVHLQPLSRNYKYAVKNFYFFNFKEQFIKENIIISNSRPHTWETVKVLVNDVITAEGINFLHQLKIEPFPTISNIFIGPPNASTGIHIDDNGCHYAINYVWGECHSKMKWFNALAPGKIQYTTAKTPYMLYKENQTELIEEIEIPSNTLMLVRIDVPHSVNNYSDKKRYCLSIRKKFTPRWDEMVSFMKPYLIE